MIVKLHSLKLVLFQVEIRGKNLTLHPICAFLKSLSLLLEHWASTGQVYKILLSALVSLCFRNISSTPEIS